MIVVLLMRLFMALLSATFNSMNRDATLAWRLQLVSLSTALSIAYHYLYPPSSPEIKARWILYAELISPAAFGETWAGELLDGEYVFIVVHKAKEKPVTVGTPSKPAPMLARQRDDSAQISIELAELKRILLVQRPVAASSGDAQLSV